MVFALKWWWQCATKFDGKYVKHKFSKSPPAIRHIHVKTTSERKNQVRIDYYFGSEEEITFITNG